MIYDAVEQAYTVAAANFTADLNALAAAKGVTAPPAATLIKRQRAETYIALGAALPALGIYLLRVATQAKSQGKRDSVVSLVFDYYLEGTDPTLLAKQAELAAEAVLRTVDRLADAGSGIYGAGEGSGSVTIELSDGYDPADENKFFHRAQVTVPVWDEDTGL
ncbi:MAG TPA: hypothetical protein VNL18_15470 [Gemmatimonadales bacterium]|nr:hypothetical protein [Gemmatimonadales bacterium]